MDTLYYKYFICGENMDSSLHCYYHSSTVSNIHNFLHWNDWNTHKKPHFDCGKNENSCLNIFGVTHPTLTKPSHPRMIVAVRRLQEQQQRGISAITGIHLIWNPMAVAYVDNLLSVDTNNLLFSIHKSSRLYFKFTNPRSKHILKPFNL
jgi:hypothetical protein